MERESIVIVREDGQLGRCSFCGNYIGKFDGIIRYSNCPICKSVINYVDGKILTSDRIRKETIEHVKSFKKQFDNKAKERFCANISDSELNTIGMLLHKHKAYATADELDILVYMQRDSSTDVESIIINLANCNSLAEALALYIAF